MLLTGPAKPLILMPGIKSLHANFEILTVVEEAYMLWIDLHDLRLFDDIPLMSHHAVDKGEAL